MAHHYGFQSDTLHDAIDSTFKNRGTDITEKSTIFSKEYAQDPDKNTQWRAFLNNNDIDLDIGFEDCIEFIEKFIEPLFEESNEVSEWDVNSLKWKGLKGLTKG